MDSRIIYQIWTILESIILLSMILSKTSLWNGGAG